MYIFGPNSGCITKKLGDFRQGNLSELEFSHIKSELLTIIEIVKLGFLRLLEE